jgi:hypothetical protein
MYFSNIAREKTSDAKLQYVHLLRQNGTEMYNPSGIGMIMAPDGDANTLEFEPAGIFSRFGRATLKCATLAKRKMVIADCLRNLHQN